MLDKKNRLKKMKDIEILMKNGRFFGGKLLTLKVWVIDEKKFPIREYKKSDLLIGFTVGKKICKSAVKRNLYKRKMREVVRLLLKENKLRAGSLMMFIAKSDILNKDYKEIEQDIVFILKKAKIVK